MSCTARRLLLSVVALSSVFFGAVQALGAITVTTLADSGPGSLREAIDTANSDGIPTTITFAPGLAGGTIALLSQLPDLTEDGTTIDGDFEGDCDPDIGIDGSSAGPGADGSALTSNNHTVRGLAFFDFDGDGLHIQGSNNVVECNYFGTNLATASGHGNGQLGIRHVAGNDNQLGPYNVVAYNAQAGIHLSESEPGGVYPLFTSLTPDNVRLYPWGGSPPFEDSFFFPLGCVFQGADGVVPTDGSGAPFSENFGLRLTGQLELGVGGDYTFETLPYDFRRLLVDGTVVIDSSGPEPYSTVVSGLSAGAHTIELDIRKDGGAAAATLTVTGPGSAALSTGASPPAGCAASLPGLCGELFRLRIPSERNTITRNSLHDNGSVGIALGWFCSPLPNDAGDLDIGPNTGLNHPAIASATFAGGGLYTISGSAPPDATVEIFSSAGDPSGYGEGRHFLGSAIADGSGNFATGLSLEVGTSLLTATATDSAGNTSEFGPNFSPTAGMDRVTLGNGLSALPGETLDIPVYVRDSSLTPLGLDRPAGERIQGIVFKVHFPMSSITAASAVRDGVLLGLTALYELAPATSSSISYLASFAEATDPIPFTLDAAAPGDVVARLSLTLAPNLPAGPLDLFLDAATTELANQAGTLDEHVGNGNLEIFHAQISVGVNSTSGLFATAVSSSAIQLTWADPNQNETGFRLERSPDSASWSPIATLGADDTSYLDTTGLAPATLYYYRLVTLIPADSQRSNVAAASTFAAIAAKTCVTQLSLSRDWARVPFAAWNGSEWGVVWQERSGGNLDEIYFQRFTSTTLAPIGAPLNISQSDATSQYPAVAWNGSQFGVTWYESQRVAPGQVATAVGYFALLNADGSIARRGVRIDLAPFTFMPTANRHPILEWDGTNWGYFTAEGAAPPFNDLVYRRLAPNGDRVLGPVSVTSTPGHQEWEIDAAFSATLSEYGVAWIRSVDRIFEIYFQRVEESTGAALGAPALLGSFSDTEGSWGLTATWDPLIPPNGGWAVAWTENTTEPFYELAVFLRRVDSLGTPLGPGPERLSNGPDVNDPAYDLLPQVKSLSSGEFVVVTQSYSYLGNYGYEIGRLHADASGVRTGSRSFVTADDGLHDSYPRLAPDGDRFLVVWNDNGPGTAEVGGLVVDAAGDAGPEVPFTSGHSPGNPILSFGPGNLQAAPLGAGFVALWTDAVSGTSLAYARIFDGSGATIANLLPLSSTPSGSVALAAVGDTFATAAQGSGNFLFARYDATGTAIVAETTIASGIGGSLGMGFDGENYAVVGIGSGQLRFQRVAPDGTPVGALQVSVASGVRWPTPRLQWTGDGWAVLYRGFDLNLYYVFLNPDGTVRYGPTVLSAPPSGGARNQFDMAFNGQLLGVAWGDFLGSDPPGVDIYFTVLNRDGSKLFPEIPAVSGPMGDQFPRLYWANGTFHLVHSLGFAPGLREIEIQTDGTVLPGERFWSNREGASAVAWNGATLGILWPQLGELYFETSACVEDLTAPVCPALSVASLANQVHLSWPAVPDPESGIWRYDLYRDSGLLAELGASTLAWDDAGYVAGTTHAYELRAMNGAFQESEGCPTVAFSTTAGDANGDGVVDAADIFYLVNFLLADGLPPAGDSDANGDGVVSATDIFYLINYLFSGGPPPVPIAGGAIESSAPGATATARRTEVDPEALIAREGRSRLIVGSATAAPGATVRIPIDLVDRPGTPLGPERPFGDRVQALALAVACSPCDGIVALAIEPAGPLAHNEPTFESRPARPGHAALVAAYDEATAPLFLGLSSSRLRQRVATLVVELAPTATAGTALDLRLDPGTTLLSNQAGTTHETVANGWLELADGRLTIGLQPTLQEP